MSLDITRLNFSYQTRPILNDVTLHVSKGEFLGLLGPNGSGKSTLLKNITGFLKPNSGSITINIGGSDFNAGNRSEFSRRVAFVPQHTSFHIPLLVREVILMGRLPHLKNRWTGYSKDDREKALSLLETLGLGHLADRDILELSGGEKQKVIIARALVQESEILLLDEATNGLDLNHVIEIMELLCEKTKTEIKH
jgi:iron complex transport system ATP-binding protein